MNSLKQSLFYWTKENLGKLRKVDRPFGEELLMNLAPYRIKSEKQSITEDKGGISETQSKNSLKRMESGKKEEDSEEKPTLKKTKQAPSPSENDDLKDW